MNVLFIITWETLFFRFMSIGTHRNKNEHAPIARKQVGDTYTVASFIFSASLHSKHSNQSPVAKESSSTFYHS